MLSENLCFVFCRKKASRGFEPRSLDSESRVLTVTPRGRLKTMSRRALYRGARAIRPQGLVSSFCIAGHGYEARPLPCAGSPWLAVLAGRHRALIVAIAGDAY